MAIGISTAPWGQTSFPISVVNALKMRMIANEKHSLGAARATKIVVLTVAVVCRAGNTWVTQATVIRLA